MSPLAESILAQAQSLPEGSVLSPKEFLHVASRAAVDQALCRLTRSGQLLRVSRGAYVVPVESRFGSRPPAPEAVARALAERNGDTLVPHGSNAANALGLTQQVPTREVFLTSGKGRTLRLGKSEVTLKHAPQWMIALGTRPAGAAVRALAWMGKAHVEPCLAALHRTLPEPEWRTLASSRASLPGWMAQAIGKENARA